MLFLYNRVYDVHATYKGCIGCNKEALGRQSKKEAFPEAFPEMNKMAK